MLREGFLKKLAFDQEGGAGGQRKYQLANLIFLQQ